MHPDRYQTKSGKDFETFEFVSIGKKGRIPKIVQYIPTNIKNMYNLGFGDKLPSGDFDDTVISDNGDSEKVLATVVATLFSFTDENKEAMVYMKGSTASRTRLYRIGITKYLKEIREDFEVFGRTENGWEKFKPNRNYMAFLVKRKI